MRKITLKRVTIFSMVLLCITFFSGAVSSVSAQDKANCQLEDQADLLTASEETEIQEQITQLEEETGWDIMAVTTNDAQGMDANEYAESWFNEYTACDDGIIYSIDMDNREIVVRTYGESIYYITDERWNAILDAGFAMVDKEDYCGTFGKMMTQTQKYYQQGIPNDQNTYDEDTHEVTTYASKHKKVTLVEALIALGIALLAGGGTAFGIIGSYRLKFGGYKYPIEKNGSIILSKKDDMFVNQFVTQRHIPKDDDNDKNSGRSSVHTDSGGRSSGGGSRNF